MSNSDGAVAPLLSRRLLLGGMGAAAGLSILPSGALASASATVSSAQLWQWTTRLAAFGPRLTGSTAHRAYVDWLAAQWQHAGLNVRRDRLTFTHWNPHRWSLEVGGKPTPLAFYFPYSGQTPAGGVTAPMVYLGPTPIADALWALAAGKIAVVDVPTPALPVAAAFPATGEYPATAAAPSTFDTQPSISDIAAAPQLNLAAAAGVRGVVCLRDGISDAFARNQYSPFTTAYQGCPAVWALPSAAAGVRSAALAGQTATLTMQADLIKGASSETLWSVLPGSHPHEAVIINTHTDGPNVAEENGGIGLLALASEFAKIPRSHRRRTLIFVATTGHFQIPQFSTSSPLSQSSSLWIEMHPELLNGQRYQAVAALTLEHLGAMEWTDDAAHTHYARTGLPGTGYCYTSTDAMKTAYLASAQGTSNNRTVSVTPPPALYFGEGHDFYKQRIATASLIPTPSYLVAAPPDGDLGKLNAKLMYGQVRTFSRLLHYLETRTAAQIGQPTGL